MIWFVLLGVALIVFGLWYASEWSYHEDLTLALFVIVAGVLVLALCLIAGLFQEFVNPMSPLQSPVGTLFKTSFNAELFL